ncbi:hypothetical protein NC652_023532 [Populus alba x Populus x berolinensis]|nr:hypothetical protein NC652_023532 [Populus alba x Populus x berolinensis]
MVTTLYQNPNLLENWIPEKNLSSMFLMGDDHSTNAYTQQEEKLTEKSLVPEMDEILSSATSWDEFKDLSVMD